MSFSRRTASVAAALALGCSTVGAVDASADTGVGGGLRAEDGAGWDVLDPSGGGDGAGWDVAARSALV